MSRLDVALCNLTLAAMSGLSACGGPPAPPGGAPASAVLGSATDSAATAPSARATTADTTAHPATSRADVPRPSAEPSGSPAAPPSARPAASCARPPYVVPPPYPEAWIDEAAASPGRDMGAWPTRPMAGPFASPDLARPGCTEVARLPAAPPFDAIVHCTTGDPRRPLGPDNITEHVLVARTARGFWSHELVREHWPHGDPSGDGARVARVAELAAVDRVGDTGAELTAVTEDGPPDGSKTRRVLGCGLGPSGVPTCADVRVAAGGPFHGAGSLLYRLTLGCDGTLGLAGWEGGAGVKLVHGRATLAFP
ncbi:MAG: hypothetical protein HY908_03525 [Myxococcales bacterium]|nr:hypothetical protein [Myxococcales bacterium]